MVLTRVRARCTSDKELLFYEKVSISVKIRNNSLVARRTTVRDSQRKKIILLVRHEMKRKEREGCKDAKKRRKLGTPHATYWKNFAAVSEACRELFFDVHRIPEEVTESILQYVRLDMETVTLSIDGTMAGAELAQLASVCGASANMVHVDKSGLARQLIKGFPIDILYDHDADGARVYAAALRTLQERTDGREHSKALYAILRVWFGRTVLLTNGHSYSELDRIWRCYTLFLEPARFGSLGIWCNYEKECQDATPAAKAKWEEDIESAYAEYLARPVVK